MKIVYYAAAFSLILRPFMGRILSAFILGMSVITTTGLKRLTMCVPFKELRTYAISMVVTALILMPSAALYADTRPLVRVAVLQFGTVNWEMDVIRHHRLDEKYHFSLEVMPVGSKNASAVALQSGAVDLIYGDWVWVNRQRFNQRLFGFSPVSSATGGLYVQADSPASSLDELLNYWLQNAEAKRLRLGIAGGSVDKSWLLLQAYSKQVLGRDMVAAIEPVFAAPPLLNQLMYDSKLPASLNFWHYSARLKARGFKPILTVEEMIKGLGVKHQVPLLGWIFTDEMLQQQQASLGAFLNASRAARQILLTSDAEWQRIRHLTRAEDEHIFTALKQGYRAGVQQQFGVTELDGLATLYGILAQEGGKKLTGGAQTLDRALFWMPDATLGMRQVDARRVP
ncbi:ABC transporter substrate-binding protein [Amphritea sp.]|uniref:ABC transporter substrate-binding protein n=1 Tax=Amphritea sp. TaxID=1872502 RepID=UPI003A8DA523